MENKRGKSGSSDRLYFLVLQSHSRWWLQPWNWKTWSLEGKLWQTLDSRDTTLLTKVHIVKTMFFPGVMYRCESWTINHKESWTPKNLCFWILVLEKTLESPLNWREITPVNPKGNKPWRFVGRTVAEAEAQNFGHLMQRANSLEKTLMLGKIKGKRRRGRQRMRWLESITISMEMN